MNPIIQSLHPSFQPSVWRLLDTLKTKHNIIMVPKEGLRSLETQGKYWRQGRSFAEIMSKVNYLKENDAPYLASIIEKVGPQHSLKKVTDAIPGYGWHNWGYALDCLVSDDGTDKNLVMSSDDPRYKIYADVASSVGMGAGYYFTRKGAPFVDAGHIQYYNKEIPSLFKLKDVNDHFAPKE